MATTGRQEITRVWQKVSDSDCTMQSVTIDDSYDVAVGVDSPIDDFFVMRLAEPVTFAYKSPVWIRLNINARKEGATITIIK